MYIRYICVLKVNDNMWNTCIRSLVPRLSSVCEELLPVFYLWNITCAKESLGTRLPTDTPVYTCITAVSRMVRVISLWRSTSGQRCPPSCSFSLQRWRWVQYMYVCACACSHVLRMGGMWEYELGIYVKHVSIKVMYLTNATFMLVPVCTSPAQLQLCT